VFSLLLVDSSLIKTLGLRLPGASRLDYHSPAMDLELSPLWVLALALLIDLVCGELPRRLHPVIAMGHVIDWARRVAPRTGRSAPFLWGALLVIGGTAVCAGIGGGMERVLHALPVPLAWLASALLLKTTFSLRELVHAGKSVQDRLESGNLPEARRMLGWHLVSRDTSRLDESQVAAAAIESLAENASDSFVAPLLYFAVGGLAGAFAYRFLNTCDAMLGYRDAEREWLGKPAARLDDLANIVPARATAVLLILAGICLRQNPLRALRTWFRDRSRTASPNAGHPMSAAAGVLGIELEKVGHYRLGEGLPHPQAADIGRMSRLLRVTAALTIGAIFFVLVATGSFDASPASSRSATAR